MASFMSASPAGSSPASVVTAILVGSTSGLAETLEAVRRQVYEPEEIVIIGGDADARRLAGAEGVEWFPAISAMFSRDGLAATHLWFLRSGAEPRPDALTALAGAATSLDAAVAGSKILDRDDPEHLLSVGFATDVFETPYTGLDDDELDQGQYDVVRDVAAVGGESLFVRRDLARGLGGPDRLMPTAAAATDFCQRARLRGARVIVVPSSEVLVADQGTVREPWRERAGRLRAMGKAYGPLTLLWTLPMAFLSGLVQSVLSLFLGRWTFFDWIRAWTWNVARLPNTVGERRRARHARVVGDEELFRYQVSGSVSLKRTWSEVSDRVRARLPGEDTLSMQAIGEELRRPALVVGIVAVVLVLAAVRSLWASGLPAVGYSLPFPGSWSAALQAYAGGWNPGGFGSEMALPPLIAVAGVLRAVVFDSGRLAEYLAIAGAALLGVWGTVRLLRGWGVTAVPGTLAGLVYIAGSGYQGLAANTAVGAMIAAGLMPLVLRLSLASWPPSALGRAGRVALIGALVGVAAAASPVMLVVPVAALLIWALLNVSDRVAWRATAACAVGTVLAVPLLFPWVGAVDLTAFLTDGAAYWTTSIVVVVAALVGALAVIVAGPRRLALVAAWGGVLAAGGALAARSGDLGGGGQIGLAGLVLVSLGLAAIAGAALETVTRAEAAGWRRVVAVVGVAAAIALLAASSTVLLGGRAGLPADRFREALSFTMARPGDAAESRVLMLGAPGDLPGEERTIQGAAYRVVSAPMVELWEALLPDPRPADLALEGVLDTIIAGETSRAGAALAAFGIRWIVVMDDGQYSAAWSDRLTGQLDIVSLSAGLDNATYEIEAEDPVRAITSGGTAWPSVGTGYEGTPGGWRLVVRENAHDRWGPGPWSQSGEWNEVSASAGVAAFSPIPGRRLQAILAGVWLLILLGFAWAGRRFG
jgi:hypothetical protein